MNPVSLKINWVFLFYILSFRLTGKSSDFDSEDPWFEPRKDNKNRSIRA